MNPENAFARWNIMERCDQELYGGFSTYLELMNAREEVAILTKENKRLKAEIDLREMYRIRGMNNKQP